MTSTAPPADLQAALRTRLIQSGEYSRSVFPQKISSPNYPSSLLPTSLDRLLIHERDDYRVMETLRARLDQVDWQDQVRDLARGSSIFDSLSPSLIEG